MIRSPLLTTAVDVVFSVGVIVLAARVVGAAARRLGQPRVLGEIVAGIILGPTFLGSMLSGNCNEAAATCNAGSALVGHLFTSNTLPWLLVIGEIGVLLFAFFSALEINLPSLEGRTSSIVLVGLGSVVLPLVSGVTIAPLLANDMFRPANVSLVGFGLFVGTILAVTALPVMVRIIQEKGLTRTRFGATATAASAVATVAMFVVLSFSSAVVAGGRTNEILLRLSAIAVFLGVLFYGLRPILKRLVRTTGLHAIRTPVLLLATALLLGVAGYLSRSLGMSVIVGGFALGMITPARGLVLNRLRPLLTVDVVVLLPVFLAYSGIRTDMTGLSSRHLRGLGLLLVAAVVSKWVSGTVLGRVGGLSWAEGNLLGILMNCRGLMVLVVGLAAVEVGAITPTFQLGAVFIALVTTAMTNPLFDRFVARTGGSQVVGLPPAQKAT